MPGIVDRFMLGSVAGTLALGCSLNREAIGELRAIDAGPDVVIALLDTGMPPRDTGTPPDTGPPDTGPPCIRELCNGADDDGDGHVDFGFGTCPAVAMRAGACAMGECTQIIGDGTPMGGELGHSYLICNPPAVSQAEAESACQGYGMGYHLTKIETQNEADFLVAVTTARQPGQQWWIGLTTSSTTTDPADFTWRDGTGLAPFASMRGMGPWSSNDPDGSGTCVRMRSATGWADHPCSNTYFYICEAAP